MGLNDFFVNNNGKKDQLNAGKHGVRREQVEKKFQNLFDAYDINQDGTLEESELEILSQGLSNFAGADKTLDVAENKGITSLFANKLGIKDADFMGFVKSVSEATEDIVSTERSKGADGGDVIRTTYKNGLVETIYYYPDGEFKLKTQKQDSVTETTTYLYTNDGKEYKQCTAAELDKMIKSGYKKHRAAERKMDSLQITFEEGYRQEFMKAHDVVPQTNRNETHIDNTELSERAKMEAEIRDFVLSHYVQTHKDCNEALETMGILDDIGAAINAGAGELWNSCKNIYNKHFGDGTESDYQNFYELVKKFEPNYGKALVAEGRLEGMREHPVGYFTGETGRIDVEKGLQLQQTTEQYQNAQILKARIEILNDAMLEISMYENEMNALMYAPAQSEGMNPASHILKANALLIAYFDGDEEAAKMLLNGTISNASGTIRAIKDLKDETEALNKSVLNGKTFEEVKNDYQKQYQEMYGTDFVPDELTEKVMDAKMTGGMVKLAAITIISVLITKSPVMAELSAAAGGAEVTGAAANMIRTLATRYGASAVQQGIKFAMTSGTLATDVGLNLINRLSSESKSMEGFGEEVAGSAKYIFVGAYIGAPLAQAVSRNLAKAVGAEKMFAGGVQTGKGAIQTTTVSGSKFVQNLKGLVPKAGGFLTDVGVFTGVEVLGGADVFDAFSEQGEMLSKIKLMNHVLEYMLGKAVHSGTNGKFIESAIRESGVRDWAFREIKTPQKTVYEVQIDKDLPPVRFESEGELAIAMAEKVSATLSERLGAANERADFRTISEEIRKLPEGEERTRLMEEYFKKYNAWTAAPERPDIRMEFKPDEAKAEPNFAELQQRLRELLKDEKDFTNDSFRRILGVLKKNPENAEFIISKLGAGKSGLSQMITFLTDCYKSDMEQSNLILELMTLSGGKYSRIYYSEAKDFMNASPEKIKVALDIIKSAKNGDEYPLVPAFKVLLEAEIEDAASFTSLMGTILNKSNGMISTETIKAFMEIEPSKRPLLEEFVNITEKTKDSTGALQNDFFRYGRKNSISTEELLNFAKLEPDKILALRDIYKIGLESGENVYDVETVLGLSKCDVDKIRMIERFANVRNEKGEYEYSGNGRLVDFTACTPEILEKLWHLSQMKRPEGGLLYNANDIVRFANFPPSKQPILLEFAKLIEKSKWSDVERPVFAYDFKKLAAIDKEKLEILLELAQMKKDGYARFDADELLGVAGQNPAKIKEIVEFMRNNPQERPSKIVELQRKTLEQLQELNGKTVDTSGMDASQLELKNLFDKTFSKETNLDVDVIHEACLREDGTLDAGAVKLVAELAPEQRYNYHDGTEFVTNTLKNFRNADGTVNYEKYAELKSVIDGVLEKFPNLDEGNMTYDAMYSLAQRSGDAGAARVAETLNFISTINNPELVRDALKISRDLNGDIDTFKTVMEQYTEGVNAGKISRKKLDKYMEFCSSKDGGVSANKIIGLLDFISKFEDKPALNSLLNYLKPGIIDEAGKFFEFANTLREFYAETPRQVESVICRFDAPPRQMDIDILQSLASVYKPLNIKVDSYDLNDILASVNETNLPLFNKLMAKFNGKSEIELEGNLIAASENHVGLYELRNFLKDIKTPDDAEFMSYFVDNNIGVYSSINNGICLPDSARALEKANASPNLKKWVVENDIKEGAEILERGWVPPSLEGQLAAMTDAQKAFLAKLAKIKTPNEYQLLSLGSFDDFTHELFKKVPPEKFDLALDLAPHMYNEKLLMRVAAELSPAEIAKYKSFIVDKGVSAENHDALFGIVKGEKTFGNREAYDKLIEFVGAEENEALSIEIISDIVSNPYNEQSFKYIMDNLETSDFVTPEAMVKYVAMDPKNAENLEFLKTSSNLIANPEVLSGILPHMKQSDMIVFNEIVNELRTHNDNLGYDLEILGSMMRFNEDMSPSTAKLFQKLYRMYDENGNHIIPGSQLYGLAENTELAGKVVGEIPSPVAKLNLADYKVSEEAVRDLAQNMPDEFKVILFNNNGEFTAKEYLQLLEKLNNNEYLRDALAEFKTTGKINLEVFENRAIALGLVDNNPQLLGIIKKSPDMIQNNPQTVKQNLSMVNELLDDFIAKYADFVKNNPGMLPGSMSIETFMKEMDRAFHGEQQSAMMFKLANIYGAKNVKSAIAKIDATNLENTLGKLGQFADSEFGPLFSKIFAMKDIGENEFNLIMRVADFTDTKANFSYDGNNTVKLLEQDFAEILEKIIVNGRFDKQAFFEDVYKGLLEANIEGFEPMTPEQLRIIAESDFISNPNIHPQDWAEFIKLKPEVQKVVTSLLENNSFENVKKILSLSDDSSNALAGISFSDKMKMLDIVDGLTKENIDALEKAGYNINSAIMKIVKALSTEKKFIQTETLHQQAFLRGIIANNNVRAEELLKTTDFTTEEFAHGIPLKYPRAKFTADVENVLSTLNPAEQSNVLKYFDIYKTEQGFEGIPVVPKKSDIQLSATERAAVDKVTKLVDEFTTKNETTVKDPELKALLDSLVKGLPEFTTVVGKVQHGTHAYTVDIHTLKVLQYAMNDPAYAKLSNQDKTILKFAALVHDFGKKEGVIDEGHATLSSEYVSGILAKFNMPESVKYRIIELVSNHHWFAAYNKGEMSSQTVATLCRNPEDFEISKILAKADLLGVNDDFFLKVTNTSTREEFDAFTADKFSYIDEKLTELRQKANIVLDTPITQNGKKFPIVKATVDGEEVDLRVLNLTDDSVTDLTQYGFAPGTTKQNARFTVHMTPEEMMIGDATASPMNVFNILSATPTHHSVQSTSLISFNNNRTYGHRKFGFVLDVDQSNISTANSGNVGSGTSKTLNDFSERLFAGYDDRSWVKSEFKKALKRKGLEMDDETYGTLAKFLYSKKYGTQIYHEYVNEHVPVEQITGLTGFSKELYAEYISPKTTPERRAEIFELCVKSKTFVIRKDGTIGIEYASKTGGIVPEDGEFRIKAKDLREALESSRDELFQGSQHSELVSMTPRVNGLIARVSRIEDCPQPFLKFAKEHNLPIILIGYKNPAGMKN